MERKCPLCRRSSDKSIRYNIGLTWKKRMENPIIQSMKAKYYNQLRLVWTLRKPLVQRVLLHIYVTVKKNRIWATSPKKLFMFLSAFSLLSRSTLFHSTHEMTLSGGQLCWPGKFASSKGNTELRPQFGPGVREEVEVSVNGVFQHITSTWHRTTFSKQEDAEALFMPQLFTLSFTSKPPTLHQSQEMNRYQPALCYWGVRRTKGFLRKSSLLALYRLGTIEQRWRISTSYLIFMAAFNFNQSRLQEVQSHFSSTVLSFSEHYHFFSDR